ncbi:MAG: DUF721 domain-containing protein [Flavobacteriales bacterium]|nr:DUF721 domain-containing protein [Flavobacteriales bacterium]
MKRRNDTTMAQAIDRLVDAYGLREKLDELEVASLWDEIVGGMVAKHTVAVKLRRGKLFIKVDSAPLRQELTFMREALKTTVNSRMKREVVQEVLLD